MSDLSKTLLEDPGLPRKEATQSYWQHVPHELAETQSPALSFETDIAIIGSGITGLSVAKSLLEKDPNARVTVLEARTLCSGATGRNGGQLVINGAETYEGLRNDFGPAAAGKIIKFTLRTLQRIREVVKEYEASEAELTDVVKLRAFVDSALFDTVKRGVSLMENDHPTLRGVYTVVDAKTCAERYGVHDVVGGVSLPAGTVWPYRMVSAVFKGLLDTYQQRLSIETNTPVCTIEFEPETSKTHSYLLHTPRGSLRASKVVHCTNGYAGHLLPTLRGPIIPVRGTMSVQDLNSQVPNRGSKASWAIHFAKETADENEESSDGLLYIAQNVTSGYFFAGGDKGKLDDMISTDDTKITSSSLRFLQDSMATFFRHSNPEQRKLVSSWSGIMGFTPDELPLVGRLDETITQRKGCAEWISAGYNGYGMPVAWLTGEVVAGLALGEEIPDWFPEPYLLTEQRLKESLTLERAIHAIKET